MRTATERGFPGRSARSSPPTSSSFIGAFLLWWLTVGPVRGFAFFLGVSTVLDLFVAYFFARPLVTLLGRSSFFVDTRFFGIARLLGPVRSTPRRAPEAPLGHGAGPGRGSGR